VARASGHAFRTHRIGRADANGRYELVVPYPTDAAAAQADVVARGEYELRSTGAAPAILLARARVSEAEVEEGRTVAVAPLAGSGSSSASPPAAAPAPPGPAAIPGPSDRPPRP